MPHRLIGAASWRAIAAALAASGLAAPIAAHAQEAAADAVSAVTVQAESTPASGVATPATSETVSAAQLADTVNLTNSEDALKYFPSLTVRKRHIGDTQAPLATRTSGLGSSARSLIYADGVLLSAPIGNNNSFASPRWGMISPDQIARVDVLYGPYSAAYAGNSIGAVVNYTTRMPTSLEAHFTAAYEQQKFTLYGTSDTYPVKVLEGSVGDRVGPFAWRLGDNHVISQSQPLTIVTVNRPTSASAAGTPVSGAFLDRNRTGAPIGIMGAGGFEHQTQDDPTIKLSYDVSSELTLAYTGGLFLNRTTSAPQTYLRDAGGNPVYTGAVNIGGYAYNLANSSFSNSLYRFDERHDLNAFSAKGAAGPWTYQAVVSDYNFDKDDQRTASGALPAAYSGGTGTLTRMGDTGWTTADASGGWSGGIQAVSGGVHWDRAQLANRKYNTADWRNGPAGALATASFGQTATQALWAQDAITPRPDLTVTLGGRVEWWKASKGYNYSLTPPLNTVQPELSADSKFSPKATAAWRLAEDWKATASYGEAYRFPTVTELYQAVTTGSNLSVPNPTLKPEHARSEELAVEYDKGPTQLRVSAFNEQVRDALISQTGLLSGSSVSFVQNVDETSVKGVEIAFDRRDLFVHGLDLSGSYTLTDPLTKKDAALPAAVGKDLPGVPRNRASLTATYRPDQRWSVSLGARYSDRSYSAIDNSDIYPATFTGFDKYLVLDARGTLQLDKGWSLAAGVDNLTDKRYFLYHPFPGRTASLELHYDY